MIAVLAACTTSRLAEDGAEPVDTAPEPIDSGVGWSCPWEGHWTFVAPCGVDDGQAIIDTEDGACRIQTLVPWNNCRRLETIRLETVAYNWFAAMTTYETRPPDCIPSPEVEMPYPLGEVAVTEAEGVVEMSFETRLWSFYGCTAETSLTLTPSTGT